MGSGNSWPSDYEYTLYSPNGTSDLVQDNESDDSACKNDRTAFNGEQASGLWRFNVDDTVSADSGNLVYWSVEVRYTPSAGGLWDSDPSYVSQVFDAGGSADFGTLTYTTTLPAGSPAVSVTTRSAGSTDDLNTATWSDPITSGDVITSPAGQFFQYRAEFTPGDDQQPSLDSIEICYCP